MFNDELTLIKIEYTENDLGDPIKIEDKTDILCSVESVTRSEFYAAASHDMQPEIIFVINKFDYNKESIIQYQGERYDVLRSYEPRGKNNPTPMDIDRLELVCKGADKNADA